MTYAAASERGFTLVELLVALGLLSLISISFFSVMLSGSRGARVAESGVDVSAEARQGLNRMIRDVREAETLQFPIDGNRFTVAIDFNRDGDTADPGEVETFTYNAGAGTITLTVGSQTETLVDGVSQVSGEPIFRYGSNFLEFDQDGDGIVTCSEADTPPLGKSGGDRSGTCNDAELPFLTNVDFSFRVTSGDGDSERDEEFHAQAQLRNRR